MRIKYIHLKIFNILIISVSFILFLSCDGRSNERDTFTVKHVVDGDTVILDDKAETHLRYLGIDAPEKLTIDSPGEPLAEKSIDFNSSMVKGKKIQVEYDEEKYDHYGRLLGYVYVDGKFVNKLLLENGLAHLLIIEPNDKYHKILKNAQDLAIAAHKGIWNDQEKFNPPEQNSRFIVKPVNITRYIDQRVVTRGKIGEARSNDHVIKLNMEDQLDIVIFKNNVNNFRYMDIDPGSYYTGFPVEVTGRVKMYRGRPQIVVDHPMSLRKLD